MLLETKFLVPIIPSQLMLRQRLFSRLGSPEPGHISLLQAPPGYGKTTLIIQWLSACELQPVWLSLDGRDNDVLRFWRYLVGAIQRSDEHIAPKAQGMLLDLPPAQIDQLVEMLLNELLVWGGGTLSSPLVLVLDDYHVINNASIHDSMAYLLDNLPSSIHVVFASRTQPPLFIERRKVRGQLIEVTSVELAFIAEETALFLKQRLSGTVSDDSIFVLQKRTEGWAAAVQLAVLSMQRDLPMAKEGSVLTRALTDLDEEVIRYLFDEVISGLDQEVRDFVIDTFGLPKMIEHTLSSAVSIDDGESLIIGGLLQKKRRSQTSGIPYFQDIPILGGIFSNKVERLVDSEILIMIRPRIIRG